MNTWFRRQHGSTLPVSSANTFTSVIKQSQNRHKTPENEIRTDETQEPNKTQEQTQTPPDDKHAKTTRRKTTPIQNRITPPNKRFTPSEFSRANSPIIFIIDMYKGHGSALDKKRERTAGRIRRRRTKQSTNHFQKTTAPMLNPRTNPRWWRREVGEDANPGGGILHR